MTLDKIAALKRTRLFAELDKNTLRVLAECAFERRFQKDEVLFVAGEEARGLYVIVKGAVRTFRVSLDGREQVIHVERAGATIAEVPVFDDGTIRRLRRRKRKRLFSSLISATCSISVLTTRRSPLPALSPRPTAPPGRKLFVLLPPLNFIPRAVALSFANT